MKYNQPTGGNANDPYVDENPATGTAGSIVPAAAIEYTQREIVNAITAAGITPDNADLTQLSSAIALLSTSIPAGVILSHAANTAPTGWLECNGAAISRTSYADLFAAIGTVFGVGDGSTTFNLPDLRGEFIRGWDNGRGIDAGRILGSAQLDALQNVTGTLGFDAFAYTGTGPFTIQSGTSSSGQTSGSNISVMDFDLSAAAGVRTAAETRPRNIALMQIIKY